jgi:hypothetical protein
MRWHKFDIEKHYERAGGLSVEDDMALRKSWRSQLTCQAQTWPTCWLSFLSLTEKQTVGATRKSIAT